MGDDDAVSLDLSNYELLWPASLFVSEGERVLRSLNASWEDQAIWLMTEALAGTTAVADFEDLPSHPTSSDDPWVTPGRGKRAGTDKREWFTELVDRADELRHAAALAATPAAQGAHARPGPPRFRAPARHDRQSGPIETDSRTAGGGPRTAVCPVCPDCSGHISLPLSIGSAPFCGRPASRLGHF
jgi:hypothetical protein